MSESAATSAGSSASHAARGSLSDFVLLTKPRITTMVLVTAAGGLWLARRAGEGAVSGLTIVLALLGTAMIVAGANALNMFLERDIDANMLRTKNRPLPAGRMAPKVALWFGVGLSVASIPILAIGVNTLTALLAVLANLSYVLAYTPMKQRSHHALLVGAVPGAIPPLLGWTAATGRIDSTGIVLFSVLFLWQIPHFLAIALFRRHDYARAGLVVMPNVSSHADVKHAIARFTLALVAASLLLVPLGVAHGGYLFVATTLGAVFLGWGCWGFVVKAEKMNRWAKSLFGVSILYLVLLFATLMIDPFA
jgi:protoheme IX farnesyltransferase